MEHLLNQTLEALQEGSDLAHIDFNQDTATLAQLLQSIPDSGRVSVWQALPLDNTERWALLEHVEPQTAKHLLDTLPAQEQQDVVAEIPSEHISEAVDILPEELRAAFVESLSDEAKEQAQSILNYDTSKVGHHIDFTYQPVLPNQKARAVVAAGSYENMSALGGLLVCNETGDYVGFTKLSQALCANKEATLSEFLEDTPRVTPDCKLKDVLYGYDANTWHRAWLPVVSDNRLMGVIWLHDIISELQKNQTASMPEPLKENDIFAPIKKVAQQRSLWLGINLITAFMASSVISVFENAVSQVVALAVLMPVVASMGGIGGSQTLAVAIRGLAMGNLSASNLKLFLTKEIYVAMITGSAWAVLIGIVTAIWFGMPMLGVVIAVAIVTNAIAAALSGVFFPYFLNRLKIDPAISGSVILTTVTDIVGFFVFLGLGALILL